MMPHVEIRPPKMYKSGSPFSHATLAEGTKILFITGQAAQGADGKLVGKGDIGRQTTQALENMKTLVEAAGGTMRDVASIRIFLTTRDHLSPVKDVRRKYFQEPYPATSVIQIAGLDDPDWLIEIEGVAVIA